MPTEITVRGAFSVFQPPERATVHTTIAYEGPAMEPVYERVARHLDALKSSIMPLKNGHDGPVTWWRPSSCTPGRTARGTRTVSSYRLCIMRVPESKSSSAISVCCPDGSASTSQLEGFRVSHINWALTSKRRQLLLKHVRTQAVRDAVTRAQQYADALDLGTIRPIAVADAGMLGAELRPEDRSSGSSLRVGSSCSRRCGC
jgi:uncharacterized protein